MQDTASEAMITFVIEGMTGGRVPSPRLALRLADAFPDARALELTLALASAAEGVEGMLVGGTAQALALYRLATLIAVDTLVLEVSGAARTGPITAGQLRVYWQSDPFFREGG